MTDYFTRADGSDELACSCGCGLTIRPSTRRKANKLREIFGEPVGAWGARCAKNPSYSGPGSSHGDRTEFDGTEPCALDLNVGSRSKRMKLLSIAIQVGFTGIGLGESKLHIDDDETKVKSPDEPIRYWLYK